MKNGFLLARSNLRAAKGQTASIAVLILLAALMLNLWLMLSMDYKQNFDRCHDWLNAEHVTLAVDSHSSSMRSFLSKTLKKDSRTSEFSLDSSMHMAGTFLYNKGEINSDFVFLEKEAALSLPVGRPEILEDSLLQSGVYVPVLYKSDDIAIGKTIEISIGGREVSYRICGFFNSVMAGSHNCSISEFLLTKDKYRELEASGYAPKSILCSVRLKDKTESADYEAELKNALSSQYPGLQTASNSYALVSQSRYISQMICSGIMSAMAFFILLIALVVIASNIAHYIQENMKKLGTLKAIGYTSHQLIASLFIQFLGISLIAALAGTGISYCLFPFINNMMTAQTGIPYEVGFLPLPFCLTFVILSGAIAFAVWLSSRRITKIEPITALRQGLHTHNFKRNRISLEKTGAPLCLALALKTTLSSAKHNITVCITMLVLSLIVVFSGLMTENMLRDMTPFLNLIVGETADSCISVNEEIESDFLHEMKADPRVQKIYLYTNLKVRHKGGLELMATVCDDFSEVNNPDVVFEGRFPKFDNEIALAAKYAREQNLKIGNEITLTAEGKEASYIISGFTQLSNHLGKDCILTRAGYERLGNLQNASYYLNLTEGTDIDDFNEDIKAQSANQITTTINIDAAITGSGAVYLSLMKIIVIAILILSAIIIVFVLYLLVRTMLGSKKRDYGILKALGFTTRQLILQTALSFMPAVILSTIIGITVCSFIINPLTALFLGSIGIVKSTFVVPVGFITAAGAGLILFAFAAACLLSLKIRRISPKALLTGE